MLLSPATIGAIQQDPIRRAFRQSSLDLRFADNKSLVDAQTGANLVTFTRASSATYVGSDGLVKTAVTNLLTNSESLTTGFTQQNTIVTSDATAAPDGTTTADLSVPNATSGSHASFRTSITFAVSTSYAMSVFVKPSGYTNFQLAFTSGFNNTNAWANFVLVDNGSLGFTGTSGTATIQALNNGWYCCSLVATSGASATTGGPALLVLDSDRNSRDPSFAGNNTSGLFIWGAQLEQSATVGDYIPTTSTINSAPRFDHNPTTGESLGLLVEEARTNVIWPSADYSGANWVRSNIQISAATTTAPDGSTCFGYEGSSASSLLKRLRNNFATTTVGTYTWSIYLKAGTENSCAITIQDGTGLNGASATILLTNGTVTTAVSNAGVNTGAAISVQAASNGFYRVSLTSTFVAALTQIQSIITWDVNGASTTTGTLFPWAAQLEAGAFATSYISTTSATVTRAADVASITGTNFSSWYQGNTGTLFFEGINTAISTTAFAVSDGSINNRLQMESGTNSRIARVVSGGTTQAANSIAYTYGTSQRFAISYATDSINFANAGTLGTEDTSATIPTVDQARIGANPTGANPLNSTIKRLVYWGQRLPNNVLQAITQ